MDQPELEKNGDLRRDETVSQQHAYSIPKYIKDIFKMQGAWHSDNTSPTVVQLQAFHIITIHISLDGEYFLNKYDKQRKSFPYIEEGNDEKAMVGFHTWG